MNTYLLIYEDYALFEVVFTCLIMKPAGKVMTVSLERKEVTSEEGLITKPNLLLKEIRADDVDLFVIPGGNVKNVYDSSELDEMLRELNKKKKVIAAICAGPVKLAKAGVLENKRFTTDKPELTKHKDDFEDSVFVNENVVVDGNIITAKPNGYIDFAIEVGKKMGAFKNDEDLNETIQFCKFHKDIRK
jgi:4-methyl-5(b-hydroxyethyl)-thiazole monophosphate biosynthesis